MGCASSKAAHGAVAAVPPKTPKNTGENVNRLNPNAAVATTTTTTASVAAKIVDPSSSVDQEAANDEKCKEEEVADSKEAKAGTIVEALDVVQENNAFQLRENHPQDPAQASCEVEVGTELVELPKGGHNATANDTLSSARPESISEIILEETFADASEEKSLAKSSDGSRDTIIETSSEFKAQSTDETELEPPHGVDLSNSATEDNRFQSNSGENSETCTEANTSACIDDKVDDVAAELSQPDAETIEGPLVPPVGGLEGRSSDPVEMCHDVAPVETKNSLEIVTDGVDSLNEIADERECHVDECDIASNKESQAGCEESTATAKTTSAESPATEAPQEIDPPCSVPAPDKGHDSAESGKVNFDSSESVARGDAVGTEQNSALVDTIATSDVVPSVENHSQHADPDTDVSPDSDRTTMTSVNPPEQSPVESDQCRPDEQMPATKADLDEITAPVVTPVIEIKNDGAAYDTDDTVQESSGEVEEADARAKPHDAAAGAPSLPPISVTESIDRILRDSDDSEPITELRNVTSMTRVLITDEKRNSKPSVVDRWGLSTTMNKIKTKALSNLNGPEETTAVATPKASEDPKSEKAASNAKPTNGKTLGWSSPKSVERVLISLSEELAPPSPPASSPGKSSPTSGKNKVSRSTSGRGSDRRSGGSSPKKEAAKVPARAPVSRELTDIEKARMFAASVLAETERRGTATGSEAGQPSSTSWWKQKVSSLQHEL